MGSVSNAIDFRLIFVAACSSIVTLLVLQIVNNYEYICIQFKECTKAEVTKPDINIKSNKETFASSRAPILQRKETISISPSSVSLVCKDMITTDFYAQAKIKDYYETDEYKNMIPKDPNWVNRKLKLLIPDAENYSAELHTLMMDNFDPLLIEPKSNRFINGITEAMNMYNEWKRWPVGDTGWKFRQNKNNMFVYTHSTPQYTLDIVKAEKLFLFSVPVIIGVFLNIHHVTKMDPTIIELNVKENASPCCNIIHLLVKCPPFIADRDFLNCGCIYQFKDGSVLFLNRKCNDTSLAPVTKDYVRGEIVLNVYHIRPNYDGNINESKITFYSLADIKGSIPSWILNNAYMETAKAVLNLEKHIQLLYDKKIIHKPGELWIPPKPFLEMMGVDIY